MAGTGASGFSLKPICNFKQDAYNKGTFSDRMQSKPLPSPRILIIDDDPKLSDLLKLELEIEGYKAEISLDGASGLIRSRTEPYPEIIILDWNLPDFSGIDICTRIRSSQNYIPIVMLTGNDEITDRVKALDAGVDDYLLKPFSMDELMARLRALRRRVERFSDSNHEEHVCDILKVSDLEMNTQTRDVSRGGKQIKLSVKEYNLLNFLMRGAGKVLERQEIMHGVWGENFYGDDNLLDVYIRYLRQKIDGNNAARLIHTVRGVGFILRDELSQDLS